MDDYNTLSMKPLPTQPALPSPPAHEDEGHSARDILAYEDKWVGWDGPVWCSRYGRFENKEDAAADDGYKIKGAPPQEERELHRCEKHGCSCRVPFQHLSYVQDIKRRVEPMVESLVHLEAQVEKLMHHVMDQGNSMMHQHKHDGGVNHPAMNGHGVNGNAEALDGDPKGHPGHPHNHNLSGGMEEVVAKLEARIDGLVHEIHLLMKNDDSFVKTGQASEGSEARAFQGGH